jgi:hypothetical protein
VSFPSSRKANFLTTDDPQAANPHYARSMLRKEYNFAELKAPDLPGTTHNSSSGALEFKRNYVLLMIGNTDELLKAVDQAHANGITTIEASDGSQLSCYFVRMDVSSWQTDTLLAIGPQSFWDGSSDWAEWSTSWRVPKGAGNSSYVSTLPEGEARVNSLRAFITDCRTQAKDGWIKT